MMETEPIPYQAYKVRLHSVTERALFNQHHSRKGIQGTAQTPFWFPISPLLPFRVRRASLPALRISLRHHPTPKLYTSKEMTYYLTGFHHKGQVPIRLTSLATECRSNLGLARTDMLNP
jgi:hypothetical protein